MSPCRSTQQRKWRAPTAQTTPQPQSHDQKHVGTPSALIEQADEIRSVPIGRVPSMFTVTVPSICHIKYSAGQALEAHSHSSDNNTHQQLACTITGKFKIEVGWVCGGPMICCCVSVPSAA